jgi:hypothetical protein
MHIPIREYLRLYSLSYSLSYLLSYSLSYLRQYLRHYLRSFIRPNLKQYLQITCTFLLFLVGAGVPGTAQQCDPWEHRLLNRMNLHLRWENIEGSPRWVEGVRPVFNRRKQLHTVTLPPGGSVTLQIDAGEMLRCLSPLRPLTETDLIVTRSNGSGMQVQYSPRWSDKRRWFLAQPPFPEPTLFKIANPISATDDKVLSFFTAKYEVPAEIARYPKPIIPVKIKKQGYHRLNPGKSLELDIKGPLRLRVETRMIFPPATSRTRQRYRLQCRIDDMLYRSLQFHTTLDRGIPLRKDENGNRIPVGSRRYAVMEIPESHHRLHYTALVPLYIDIWAADSPGEPGLLPIENRALDMLTATGLRETGLTAAALMQEGLSPGGTDRTDLSTRYRTGTADMWNHHTFYRSLPPWQKGTQQDQVTAVFFSRHLLPLNQIGMALPGVFYTQFLEDDMQNRSTGIFFPVPSAPSPGESVYHLPVRSVPSRLRIAALRHGSKKPVHLQIQMDRQPPVPLILHPQPDAPHNRLEADSVEALETLLTLDPLIALPISSYPSRPTLPTAEAELLLPPGIKSISLTSNSPLTTSPVYVSLSYRTSRPYRMSESQYLHAMERYGTPEGLKLLLKKKVPPTNSRYPEQEFIAHHQPLIRLLFSRKRIFSRGLKQHIKQHIKQHTAPYPPTPYDTEDIKKQAHECESQSQWLNALESWNRLLHTSTGETRQQALRGRLRALVNLGEPFLVEQQLKGIILFEKNTQTREEAVKHLTRFYKNTGHREKLLNLQAVEVLRNPSRGTISRLTAALVQNGLMEPALQAGMFLLGSSPNKTANAPGISLETLECLLTAALNTRMYETYHRLCRLLQPEFRPYWIAIGRTVRGKPLLPLDFLARWIYIMTQLPANPAQWVPEDVNHVIRDSAGAAYLYSIDRDLYALHHRATPHRPVTMEIQGPVRLKLLVRNITGGPPAALRGASGGQGAAPPGPPLSLREGDFRTVPVSVEGCGERVVIPVRRFPMSDALEVIGPPGKDFQVGLKEEIPLELGEGIHRIAVTPGSGTVLVQVSALRPALPLLRHWIEPPAVTFAPTISNLTAVKTGLLLVTNFQGTNRQSIQKTLVSHRQIGIPAEKNWTASTKPRSNDRFLNKKEIEDALMTFDETSWEPVTAIVNSAGLTPVTVAGWEPESPSLRIRRALMSPVPRDRIVTTTSDTLRMTVRFLEPHKILADISTIIPDYMEYQPLPVEIRLDGSPVQTVNAVPGNEPQIVRFTVPAGRHIISLHPLRHQPNHFVVAGFTGEDDGQPIIPSRDITRLYHVATHREPLHLKINAPARLRLDYIEHPNALNSHPRTITRQVTVPGNINDIYLLPGGQVLFQPPTVSDKIKKTGPPHTLYRVFLQVPRTRVTPLPGLRQDIIPLESAPYPQTGITFSPQNKPVKFHDVFTPGGQEDGTWAAGLEYRQYRPILEEGGDPDEADILDRYTQFTLTHRFFNPYKNRYTRTELFTRIRQEQHPTFGLTYRLYIDPGHPKSKMVFDLGASALLQKPSRDSIPNEDGIEGSTTAGSANDQVSLKAHARVRFQQRIDSQVMHLPALEIFARYLSASSEQFARDWFLDPDIYTRYKSQHRCGLVIEDLLVIRPWETTRWWLGGSVTTNESLNPFKPDYVTGRFMWKQNTGWGQLDIQYRLRRYFKDKNRTGSYYSQLLALRFNLDIWLNNRRRLELGTRFSWDWGQEQSSFSLYLVLHMDKGRGYRDYNPSQLDFKELKERRLLFKPNLESNRIGDIPWP